MLAESYPTFICPPVEAHNNFHKRNYKDLMKPLEIQIQCDRMEMTKTGNY